MATATASDSSCGSGSNCGFCATRSVCRDASVCQWVEADGEGVCEGKWDYIPIVIVATTGGCFLCLLALAECKRCGEARPDAGDSSTAAAGAVPPQRTVSAAVEVAVA